MRLFEELRLKAYKVVVSMRKNRQDESNMHKNETVWEFNPLKNHRIDRRRIKSRLLRKSE